MDGYAVISEGAWIKDEAVVKDFAIVQGWARVRDKGMVYDNACVSGKDGYIRLYGFWTLKWWIMILCSGITNDRLTTRSQRKRFHRKSVLSQRKI